MTVNTRVRSPIMELYSGRAFANELQASQSLNLSRYYIRLSLKNKKIVLNELKENCAFSSYFFGMDTKQILNLYE
jgi:hypothetical protein